MAITAGQRAGHARPLQGSWILFVVGQHFPYHRMGKSAAGEGGGDLVALTGGEL